MQGDRYLSENFRLVRLRIVLLKASVALNEQYASVGEHFELHRIVTRSYEYFLLQPLGIKRLRRRRDGDVGTTNGEGGDGGDGKDVLHGSFCEQLVGFTMYSAAR